MKQEYCAGAQHLHTQTSSQRQKSTGVYEFRNNAPKKHHVIFVKITADAVNFFVSSNFPSQ